MALWKILSEGGRTIGQSNAGETEQEAIAHFVANWNKPVYCFIHADLDPSRVISREENGMGYISCPMPKIGSAVRMRQIYCNGGYSVIEA